MVFSAAATAAGVIRAAAVAGVAGECEHYEDRDDDPDQALVVVEESAKTVVIHSRPPKSFLRIFDPR